MPYTQITTEEWLSMTDAEREQKTKDELARWQKDSAARNERIKKNGYPTS